MTTLGAYRGIVRDALGHMNSAERPDPTQTFHRANMPRIGLSDLTALATGVMTAVPIFLNAGDLVTNLSFISGATAAGTPTNYWFALYNTAATPALMAQTADQTNAAWAADTVKTLALSTPQRISSAGIYWAACMVTATTPPTLVGSIGAKKFLAGEGDLAVSSGSTLTATATATLASPAFKRTVPLVVAS